MDYYTAVPASDEYEFDHWEVNMTNDLPVSCDLVVTAVFNKVQPEPETVTVTFKTEGYGEITDFYGNEVLNTEVPKGTTFEIRER